MNEPYFGNYAGFINEAKSVDQDLIDAAKEVGFKEPNKRIKDDVRKAYSRKLTRIFLVYDTQKETIAIAKAKGQKEAILLVISGARGMSGEGDTVGFSDFSADSPIFKSKDKLNAFLQEVGQGKDTSKLQKKFL